MKTVAVPNAGGDGMHSGLADPHQKGPLTTPIGRIIERASYVDLFSGGLLTVVLSTGYFAFAPKEHSLNTACDPTVLEAAYFSVVTFTSLGYGDMSPQGFGRLVAVAVVLIGLAMIALLVGKFASERQQAILQLLHSSDCQRRLADFAVQLATLSADLQTVSASKSLKQMQATSRDLSNRVEAASNFLVFNANQAKLIEFGNESSLVALYLQLQNAHRVCIDVHKAEKTDLAVSRRTRGIANRCFTLVRLMSTFHDAADHRTSYVEAVIRRLQGYSTSKPMRSSPLTHRVRKILGVMVIEDDLFKRWTRGGLTPAVREQVWSAAPSGIPATWPAGIHKQLAEQLGISNNLAQKCLDALLKGGRLPK